MGVQEQEEHLAAAQSEESAVIWHFDLMSEVGFTWLLNLDCAYGSKQSALTPSVSIQSKCRDWRWTVQYSLRPTEVFFPPAIYFLAVLVLAYIVFFLFEGIFTPEATCLWVCCMEGY